MGSIYLSVYYLPIYLIVYLSILYLLPIYLSNMPIMPIFLVPVISITYLSNHLSSTCLSTIVSIRYTCISITYGLSDHLFTYHPSSFTFNIYYIHNLYICNIPHFIYLIIYLSLVYTYLSSIFIYYLSNHLSIL